MRSSTASAARTRLEYVANASKTVMKTRISFFTKTSPFKLIIRNRRTKPARKSVTLPLHVLPKYHIGNIIYDKHVIINILSASSTEPPRGALFRDYLYIIGADHQFDEKIEEQALNNIARPLL